MTLRNAWWAVIATAAAVLLVTGIYLSVSGTTGRASDGPLELPGEHGWALTVPAGQTFTDGMETMSFVTGSPVTIDAVRIVTDGDGLELVGVLLGGADREHGAIQFDEDFPPANPEFGTLRPAVGQTFEPQPGGGSEQWMLVLGLRFDGAQRVVRRAIEIDYTVDGRTYQATYPAWLAVCPGDVITGGCEQAGNS